MAILKSSKTKSTYNTKTGKTSGGGSSSSNNNNVVQFSAETGERLAPGAQTTDALGNTYTQGSIYTSPKAGDVMGTYDPSGAVISPYDAEITKLAGGVEDIDENAIRKSTLRQFQAETDAVNALYAQKLADTKVLSQQALGSDAALQGRRGMVGSSFGAAQTGGILTQNQQKEGAVENEKLAKLAAINQKAREAADKAVAEKKAAKAESVQTHLAYLKEAETRKATNADLAAADLVAQELDLDELTDTDLNLIVKGYGITPAQLRVAYKKIADAEAARLAKEEADFTLSEGQARYDADGNLVASRSKTYAPKASSGSGSGGGSSSGGTVGSDLEFLYNSVRTGKNSATVPILDSAWRAARNDRDRINLLAQNVVLPGPIKSDLIQRSAAIPMVDGALNLLNDGVKTGYFKNLGEKAANTFGATTDPNIAKIKQYLVSAIQPYRSSVTGAAWGTQEEAEYQALFGSTLDNPAFLKTKLENLKKLMLESNIATISSGLSLADSSLASQYLGGTIPGADTTTTTQPGMVTIYSIKTGTPAQIPQANLSKALASGLFRQ